MYDREAKARKSLENVGMALLPACEMGIGLKHALPT